MNDNTVNATPVQFTEAEQTQLLRGLLDLAKGGVNTRDKVIDNFDSDPGVLGWDGIGPVRSALIKRALSLGPGRWKDILTLIGYPQDPEPAPMPERRIVMLFVYQDYPGAGANDFLRSFRASIDEPGTRAGVDPELGVAAAVEYAKGYFAQWLSGADLSADDTNAHIAELDTVTGAMKVLTHWGIPEGMGTYSGGVSKEWTPTRIPIGFGTFLDLPQGGTHSGFVEIPGVEETTDGPIGEGVQLGGFMPDIDPNSPYGLYLAEQAPSVNGGKDVQMSITPEEAPEA